MSNLNIQLDAMTAAIQNPVPGMTLAVPTTLISSAASTTISGLSSGVNYMILMNLIQNTSNGYAYVRFNGDSGANYRYTLGQMGGGSAVDYDGAAGQSLIILSSTVNLILAGETFNSTAWLHTKYGDNNKAEIRALSGTTWASGTQVQPTASGQYSGAANLSSITIATSAGTLSGTVSIYIISA